MLLRSTLLFFLSALPRGLQLERTSPKHHWLLSTDKWSAKKLSGGLLVRNYDHPGSTWQMTEEGLLCLDCG